VKPLLENLISALVGCLLGSMGGVIWGLANCDQIIRLSSVPRRNSWLSRDVGTVEPCWKM
jgi:hypothetical protein